jgi:hypothetical protein
MRANHCRLFLFGGGELTEVDEGFSRHSGSENLQCRFVGTRPVSALADAVMRDCRLTPRKNY